MKLRQFIIFLQLVAVPAMAVASDLDDIDQVMRGIAVKYFISQDRTLPKKDRAEWEQGLSEYVDFAALTANTELRIEQAIKALPTTEAEKDNIEYLQQKGVAFIIPRFLTRSAKFYLVEMDKTPKIKTCANSGRPNVDHVMVICYQQINPQQIRIDLLVLDEDELTPFKWGSLMFNKTSQWKLTDLMIPVDDKMISFLAQWK